MSVSRIKILLKAQSYSYKIIMKRKLHFDHDKTLYLKYTNLAKKKKNVLGIIID